MTEKTAGYNFIMFSTLGIVVASWIGYEPMPDLAVSTVISFVSLDLLGMFNVKEQPEETSRSDSFRAKFKEAEEEELKAVLHLKNKDGTESSVTLYPDGEIEVKGKVPEEIITAMFGMREVVKEFGPQVCVDEINKQLKEKGINVDD